MPGARQVLFLDFDGAFVDPSVFGTDSGDLSPLADFLPGWGLGPDDESALIDAIVATFRENLHDDPHERGGNARFDVDIRNSRDHADPWGEPNVTRIIIGGTREQLDFPTVGLAQSVDPGNFAREETGVVLLDQASSPAGSGWRRSTTSSRPASTSSVSSARSSASSRPTRPGTCSATTTPPRRTGWSASWTRVI